ncbi:unnamed protein product [Polarella glacialis]|uniref:Histone-lysine N-methyltransferase, H3 lysine-79 specific n=1 Tax=Polarella glacialis TaxID=89957 RepID=A0A813H4J9_POLGL|nr:unnamed protein product [Polarella glacialis]
MGQLDTAASEADSAEEEAPEEVTGALEAPEAGEAAVEAPEAVSAPVKVSVAETGGVGVPVLRQRPKKAAGNSHAAAVKFLKSAYLQGKSGYGGDHVCESANGLEATNLGYGEVAVSGMETLYSVLNISAGDVFYDLGSGTGKLPLYVALRGEVSSSTGIEVGERRHRLAEEAGVRLKSELAKGTERAADDPPPAELDAECSAYSLVLGDIRQSIYSDATVVVMSNLCMDQSVQNRAVQNLLACPGLRNMASTVPLPAHQRLQRDRAVNVTCTWAKTSTWHIYSVLPPASKLKQSGGVGVGYGRSPAAAVASRILRPLQLAKPGGRFVFVVFCWFVVFVGLFLLFGSLVCWFVCCFVGLFLFLFVIPAKPGRAAATSTQQTSDKPGGNNTVSFNKISLLTVIVNNKTTVKQATNKKKRKLIGEKSYWNQPYKHSAVMTLLLTVGTAVSHYRVSSL